MTDLEYWVGMTILASVRRAFDQGDLWPAEALHRFYAVKGGYRSLLFRTNSYAFHKRTRTP